MPPGIGLLLNTTSSNATAEIPRWNTPTGPPARAERVPRMMPVLTAWRSNRLDGRSPPASFSALWPDFLHASPIERVTSWKPITSFFHPNPPSRRIIPPGFSSPVRGVRVGVNLVISFPIAAASNRFPKMFNFHQILFFRGCGSPDRLTLDFRSASSDPAGWQDQSRPAKGRHCQHTPRCQPTESGVNRQPDFP